MNGMKYGEVTVSGKELHPGEAVFLFRGTDAAAPAAVRDYAMRCRVSGCSDAHVNGVLAAADRMAEWQAANPTLVKLPD